jgi:hypothetical protein
MSTADDSSECTLWVLSDVMCTCFSSQHMRIVSHYRLTGKSGLWEYLVVHAATEMSKTLDGYNMVKFHKSEQIS